MNKEEAQALEERIKLISENIDEINQAEQSVVILAMSSIVATIEACALVGSNIEGILELNARVNRITQETDAAQEAISDISHILYQIKSDIEENYYE